jgi:hypothetical protein
MKKIDYKKELKELYDASTKTIAIIDVVVMKFLMIDGHGDPNTSKDYKAAVEALFALSYALKFIVKKGDLKIDYGVLPLEGLWWVDDMSKFNINDKRNWKWTAMIMQPDFITDKLFKDALEQVEKKKNLSSLSKVRFERFLEGKAAQIMHVGPFTEEGPVIEKIHTFIKERGLRLTGKHHEIYLSDIRKADPAKWKPIIRQPVR